MPGTPRCLRCGNYLVADPASPDWNCRACCLAFRHVYEGSPLEVRDYGTDGDVDAAIARGEAQSVGPYR